MANKYRNIFFMRLILFFSIVLVVTFSAVLVFNSQYINQKGINQMDADALMMIMESDSFLQEKLNTTKRMISSLYNINTFQRIPEDMLIPPKDFSAEQSTYLNTLNEYLQLGISNDPDILTIGVYTNATNKVKLITNDATMPNIQQNQISLRISQYQDTMAKFGPSLLPVIRDTSYSNNRFILPTISPIKSIGMSETIGYLLIDFSLTRIDSYVEQYQHTYTNGRMYIVSSQGIILYDSRREDTGNTISPEIISLDAIPLSSVTKNNMYVRSTYNAKTDLYFITATPIQDVKSDLMAQKLPIFFLVLGLSLLGVAATSLYVKRYSKRISLLTKAMDKICNGELSTRIMPDNFNDEITMLSDNFNEMCNMLEIYIQEVYVAELHREKNKLARLDAELKERNAQLYALQTQINPHFLYNSLESMRMMALAKGQREIAQMANILSDLFRYSVKSDFVITVEEEIHNCELYLSLVKLRFPGIIDVKLEIDKDTLQYSIASQVLQPLVENFVNHGLQHNQNNVIAIQIRQATHKSSNILIIQVSDNGRGIEHQKLCELNTSLKAKQGIVSRQVGLANVNQRIRMLFGESWGVQLKSTLGKGTTAIVKMPAMNKEEVAIYVQSLDS